MQPEWKSISSPGNYRSALSGRYNRGGAPLLGRESLPSPFTGDRRSPGRETCALLLVDLGVNSLNV